MATISQGTPEKPPSPGGDPDQPDDNVPVPPARNDRKTKDKERSGYGHTGNREEVPAPEGAPKPHQIFESLLMHRLLGSTGRCQLLSNYILHAPGAADAH
jgi:hypothetical protein